MVRDEDYVGREQSRVKHEILRRYLGRFAHIIGTKWETINYVDCFSGPWKSNSPDLTDTSFAIALDELRQARDTHQLRGRLRTIRCIFLEEDAVAFSRLHAYAAQQTDVTIETRNTEMLQAIPDILNFVRSGGRDSFTFFFIDPTGWSGFDLDRIKPLLQHQPGEVLINFMTEHIRRFIDDQRPEIHNSFRRLFGTDEVFARLRNLYGDDFRERNSQDVEDELFTFYATRVREAGQFTYVCPAVVLFPDIEKTYFHLIYATRHRSGVAAFKCVEKEAFDVQEQIRAEAEQRKDLAKTKVPSLFADSPQPPSHRAVALRERYLAVAQERISQVRGDRTLVPYEEIWDAAMTIPLVWESDVKEWVAEGQTAKRLRLLNLDARQRIPKLGKGHVVEFLS